MAERRRVATTNDVATGELKLVETDGKRIVLYNVAGELYATDATCPHQGGPLGDGLLDDHIVTCPWHAWQFDVRDGHAVYDEGVSVGCYRVIVEGTDVLIEV